MAANPVIQAALAAATAASSCVRRDPISSSGRFPAAVAILLGFSPKFGALIHTIPLPAMGGVSIVIFGLIALREARIGAGDRALAFTATGICFLAGFWQTLTHVTLWADAGDPGKPWGPVILHGTAGPAITILAAWLMLRPQGAR